MAGLGSEWPSGILVVLPNSATFFWHDLHRNTDLRGPCQSLGDATTGAFVRVFRGVGLRQHFRSVINVPRRPGEWGHCCSKASVRFQFSEQREILLTTLRGLSFCSSGRGTIEAVSSTPSGRCTMRNHDFVSDGFLAVTAASLVLLCSGLLAIALS
jgi:hypothetical protein